MLRNVFFFVMVGICGLVLSCSGAPSLNTVKTGVVKQIKMEGGKDVQFSHFEIERLAVNASDNSWRVRVRMKGKFVQNPHLDFDKAYEFDTTRKYEFVRSAKWGWRAFTIGMRPLYKEPSSHEIIIENDQLPEGNRFAKRKRPEGDAPDVLR